MKFETKAIRIQTGQTQQREHSTPLFPTSSFTFEDAEQMRALFADEQKGNIYSRFSNPNCTEFENKMAALEGMEAAVSTATGMAAIFASFAALLTQGEHIIASRAVFGSTYQLLTNFLTRFGIEHTFVDVNQPDTWVEALRPNSKLLFIETPSNPGLDIIDLEFARQFAEDHNLFFSVDNCFATPYLQNPAAYGADIVIHSATKFIDGQGRVLGGAICGSEEVISQIRKFARNTGPALSPFNAWILSKSLETLPVRMDRHCENAYHLATQLQDHPKINKVKYPFLESHPMYSIAKKQMRYGGGLFTFELKGGLAAGRTFLDNLQMLSLSANLGDTRTIATHPASSTHHKLPVEERAKLGITDGLVRVSVGLEHREDILGDILQSLEKI